MELVELGKCNKPHGIKGGFLFHLFNAQDSVLGQGVEVFLTPLGQESSISKEGSIFKIQDIQFGNKTICYLEGITDRNVVESMLPFKIEVSRDIFPETKDGEFYVVDLVGLPVSSQDGFKGKIKDYYDNGAQIVFVIQAESGEEIDIPFTKQFFPVVDVESKIIEIVVPEFI